MQTLFITVSTMYMKQKLSWRYWLLVKYQACVTYTFTKNHLIGQMFTKDISMHTEVSTWNVKNYLGRSSLEESRRPQDFTVILLKNNFLIGISNCFHQKPQKFERLFQKIFTLTVGLICTWTRLNVIIFVNKKKIRFFLDS